MLGQRRSQNETSEVVAKHFVESMVTTRGDHQKACDILNMNEQCFSRDIRDHQSNVGLRRPTTMVERHVNET